MLYRRDQSDPAAVLLHIAATGLEPTRAGMLRPAAISVLCVREAVGFALAPLGGRAAGGTAGAGPHAVAGAGAGVTAAHVLHRSLRQQRTHALDLLICSTCVVALQGLLPLYILTSRRATPDPANSAAIEAKLGSEQRLFLYARMRLVSCCSRPFVFVPSRTPSTARHAHDFIVDEGPGEQHREPDDLPTPSCVHRAKSVVAGQQITCPRALLAIHYCVHISSRVGAFART